MLMFLYLASRPKLIFRISILLNAIDPVYVEGRWKKEEMDFRRRTYAHGIKWFWCATGCAALPRMWVPPSPRNATGGRHQLGRGETVTITLPLHLLGEETRGRG